MIPYLRLAIHAGGGEAPVMAARMGAASPIHHPLAGGSFSTAGGAVHATTDRLVAVGGQPLGLPALDSIVDADDFARRLSDCDGLFYAVYWDAKARRLTLVTDFLGQQPLYLRRRPGELLLASETKAFRGEPDLGAWGSFVLLGHPIGSQTLMRDLHRAPAGTVLTWDAATDATSERPYWRWPEPSEHADIDGVVDALRDSVRRNAKIGTDGALFLSGGLDSRLVLCVMREIGLQPDAITVSHRDEHFDADARIAAQVARQQGVPLHRREPAAHYFSSPAYLRYIADCDAGLPSLNLFIAQVAHFARRPALWHGQVPGHTLNLVNQPPGGFDTLFARNMQDRDSAAWRATTRLFRRETAEAMYDGFEAMRREEVAKYSDDGWGTSQFVTRNRSRLRTSVNPYQVYAKHTGVLTPGMTRDYFNVAGRLSRDVRADYGLYRQLLRRHFPRSLDIPICSGGALLAGRSGSWRLAYERAIAAGFRFGRRQPRIARLFGMSDLFFSFPASRFADPAALVDDDPHIEPGYDIAAEPDPAVARAARRLLFHWRSWQWLHQGVLFDRLGPLAVTDDEAA